MLETLAAQGYAGHVVVEVATRRAGAAQRELDIAESLAFARLHLAAPVCGRSADPPASGSAQTQ